MSRQIVSASQIHVGRRNRPAKSVANRLNRAVAMIEPMEARLLLTAAPAFVGGATATGFPLAGVGFTLQVHTTGAFAETPKITERGALPAGLHFKDDGTGTAEIFGNVGKDAHGSFVLNLAAKDSSGDTAAQVLTLSVEHIPVFTSPAKTTFTLGSAGTFTIKTMDGTPVTSLSATLDGSSIGGATHVGGFTFVDNGDGTATLSGTPTGSGGEDDLIVDATSSGGSDLQDVKVTILQKPASTGDTSTDFTVGHFDTTSPADNNNEIAFGIGFPTPSISITSGHLPGGLKFKDNGDGTADIAGTPAAGTGGDYTLTVTAKNTAGSSAGLTYVVHVDQTTSFTTPNNATFTVGKAQTFNVKATGFPVPSFVGGGAGIWGGFPDGLTFTGAADGTATFSGTPTAGSGGIYRFTLTDHNNDDQPFVLTVNEAPTIDATGSSTILAGQAIMGINFETNQNGFGGTLKMSKNGSLPKGLTFTDLGSGEARITGTPDATSGGIYKFSVVASNSIGSETEHYTLQVDQAPTFSGNNTSKSVNVKHGNAVNQNIGLTGFDTPFGDLANVSGGLTQNGLTLALNSNNNGLTLSGTPASAGTTTFSFTVDDSDGDAGPTLTLTVNVA